MPVTLSYSAVRDYRRCKQLFHYKRVDKLKRKRKSKPLYIGSLTHEVIELYLRGERMSPKIEEIQAEYDKLWEEEQELLGDVPRLIRGIAKAYKETYPDDPQKTKAVELDFTIPVDVGVFLTGKIDWIVEERNGLFVVDHKTTSRRIPSEGFRIFDLQTALYVHAARHLGYDIQGIGFNYIRTKEPRIPSLNKNGTMSKRKINTDIDTLRKFMQKHGLDPEDYPEQVERAKSFKRFERKLLPKPATLVDILVEEFIRTAREVEQYKEDPLPTRNLSRDCESCEYHALCIAELMSLDKEYLLKVEYEVKDDIELDFTDVDDEEEGGDSTDGED